MRPINAECLPPMMAKSQENVGEILRSVDATQALEIQKAIERLCQVPTNMLGMLDGTRNPDNAP